MSNVNDLPTRDEFVARVHGATDRQILDAVVEYGTERLVSLIGSEFPGRYRPGSAAHLDETSQWQVRAHSDVVVFNISFHDDQCLFGMGPADDPRVTFIFDAPAFLRFVTGQVGGGELYISGELKLEGDMLFAEEMSTFFGPAD